MKTAGINLVGWLLWYQVINFSSVYRKGNTEFLLLSLVCLAILSFLNRSIGTQLVDNSRWDLFRPVLSLKVGTSPTITYEFYTSDPFKLTKPT